MTQAMGLTRAIAESEKGWSEITHVGSNSGGNWFASQLFYSEKFFAALTDTTESLEDFVVEWGATYEATITAAIDSGAAWATELSVVSFSALHPLCTELESILLKALGPLDKREFPAWVWVPYITAMLKPWISDIDAATYSARQMTGLQTATLVQQVSLPPDAFLDESVVATQTVHFIEPFQPNTTSTSYVVPLAHVQPPTSSDQAGGHWNINLNIISDITATTNTLHAPTTSLLYESRDPLLIEVASASSSAAGLIASPAMTSEWTSGVIDSCWPLGLETLAASMFVNGFTLPQGQDAVNYSYAEPSSMVYRYLDGAYTDNTNAAMTLSQMQKECSKGATGLDCSSGYRMIIAGDSGQESLWFNEQYPPGSFIPPSLGGFNGPVPVIFAGPFPDEWVLYSSDDLYHNKTRADSFYWHGRVTTIQNDWYGVIGGDSVEVLYFIGDWDPIDIGGESAALLFKLLYAPSAVAQASGASPVIEKFLRGEL